MTREEAIAFLDNWFTALAKSGKAKTTPAEFSQIAAAYNVIKAAQPAVETETPKLASASGK